MSKIVMGADPYGFELKNAVKAHLINKGYQVDDLTDKEPVSYCHVGHIVGEKIAQKIYDTGFVFCGTGMGVSIVANKHSGVYCGICESVTTARLCKIINNCNILAMGGLLITPFKAKMMVDAFLDADFSHGAGFIDAPAEDLQAGLCEVKNIEKSIYP